MIIESQAMEYLSQYFGSFERVNQLLGSQDHLISRGTPKITLNLWYIVL